MNVFKAILQYGHDEDFEPDQVSPFEATDAPAGSSTKIEEMARRVALGVPMWHPKDRADYSDLVGVVRPRD